MNFQWLYSNNTDLLWVSVLLIQVYAVTTSSSYSQISDGGRRVNRLQVYWRLQREFGELQHWEMRAGERWREHFHYYMNREGMNIPSHTMNLKHDNFLWGKVVCIWQEVCTCWLSVMIFNNQLIWNNQQTISTDCRAGGTGSDLIIYDERAGGTGSDLNQWCQDKTLLNWHQFKSRPQKQVWGGC